MHLENLSVKIETLVGNILGCVQVPPAGKEMFVVHSVHLVFVSYISLINVAINSRLCWLFMKFLAIDSFISLPFLSEQVDIDFPL